VGVRSCNTTFYSILKLERLEKPEGK